MEARAAATGTESPANIEIASPANAWSGTGMGVGAFRRAAARNTSSVPGTFTPFVIGSEAVLRELAEKVNNGATWANGDISYAECSYVLREDVALTSEWTPIGTEEHAFCGTFDGNGFVIRGVTIDDPDLQNCGLFGYD